MKQAPRKPLHPLSSLNQEVKKAQDTMSERIAQYAAGLYYYVTDLLPRVHEDMTHAEVDFDKLAGTLLYPAPYGKVPESILPTDLLPRDRCLDWLLEDQARMDGTYNSNGKVLINDHVGPWSALDWESNMGEGIIEEDIEIRVPMEEARDAVVAHLLSVDHHKRYNNYQEELRTNLALGRSGVYHQERTAAVES